VTPVSNPEHVETIHSSPLAELRPLTSQSAHFRTPSPKVEKMQNDITNTSTELRWNTTGSTVAGTGVSGSTETNRLNDPSDIVLDSSNALYIADQSNNRVVKWITGESTGTTVAGQANGGNLLMSISGTNGSALSQLSYPNGINFDSSSSILYVADTNNHRIMSYASNSSIGTLVAGGNGSGTSSHQLYSPYAVHFDSFSNSLVIANYGAHNIVRWVIGASGWTLIAGYIGSYGSTAMTLTYPTDAIFDPMGNIYVADRNNDRIQFFRAGQTNGTTIVGISATPGNTPNLLYRPYSIALDKQLNLYVTDSNNNRVQKFQRY
ncbi:unnamed protein product, partial [Rotaria sp. Silwood1]